MFSSKGQMVYSPLGWCNYNMCPDVVHSATAKSFGMYNPVARVLGGLKTVEQVIKDTYSFNTIPDF